MAAVAVTVSSTIVGVELAMGVSVELARVGSMITAVSQAQLYPGEDGELGLALPELQLKLVDFVSGIGHGLPPGEQGAL